MSEGLRPSDSLTRSLARRFAGALRSRGSLAALARAASIAVKAQALLITTPSMSRLDLLLLLMTVIWGTNYALVKSAFQELDPQAFNALRLIVLMRGASPLGLPDTLSRAPLRRRAPFAWLARSGSLASLVTVS